MSDPFDVLRRELGRTEPDAQFRAQLMSEVANALTVEDPSTRSGPSTFDKPARAFEPAPLLEVIMRSRPITHRNHRAVAGILGVAAAIVAVLILALRGTGDPAVVSNSSTTAVPTTSAARHLADADVAKATLLAPKDYAHGWVPVTWKQQTMDAVLAGQVPGCAKYADVVFESTSRLAVVDYAWYSSTQGYDAGQYVVVFPTEAAAKAMFAATIDPAFLSGCLPGYWAKVGADCCDPSKETSPLWIGDKQAPTMSLEGDESALRSTEASWVDQFGHPHGPVRLVGATVRVGRTVTIITMVTADEHGQPLVTTAQFQKAVATLVGQARRALNTAAS